MLCRKANYGMILHLPPWKVSTCKATGLVFVVQSTNKVNAWLLCSGDSVFICAHLSYISYCFHWLTQHVVWIFSIFFFYASGASKSMAKRARIVLTSYQKQRILSLFEGAVKYNSTHMHACLPAIEWDAPHIHEHSRIQLPLHSWHSL